MPKKAGPNQKAVAAAEKKAVAQSVKDSKAEAQRERELAEEWSKGANNRGLSKAEEAAAKADEAARKKREKAALLAEEEAAIGAGGKPKKTPVLSKGGKGKKKGGNDLSLLENALVSGAEKKMKAKKQEEREKAEKLKLEQTKKKEEDVPMDPLLANTEDMIRGTADDLVGRAANKALDEENAASGIDGALDTLNISGGAATSAPSAKALYKAFEERMMPEMKADYPGLKLSQYKDKIFQQWKKSSENPANQPKA
jgi:Coiled-coil domain-containing protein 124 /Oxs1